MQNTDCSVRLLLRNTPQFLLGNEQVNPLYEVMLVHERTQLLSGEEEERVYALKQLFTNDPDTVPLAPLLFLLNDLLDPHPGMRVFIVWMLPSLRNRTPMVLVNHHDLVVRVKALWALGALPARVTRPDRHLWARLPHHCPNDVPARGVC